MEETSGIGTSRFVTRVALTLIAAGVAVASAWVVVEPSPPTESAWAAHVAPDARSCDPDFAARPQRQDLLSNEPMLLEPVASRDSLFAGYRRSGLNSPAPGRVQAWILIGTAGRVEDAQLYRSSGVTAVDSAALRGVRAFRFQPGDYLGEARCVWVLVPIPGP